MDSPDAPETPGVPDSGDDDAFERPEHDHDGNGHDGHDHGHDGHAHDHGSQADDGQAPGGDGGRATRLDLPCGESISTRDLDLGMREYDCACGDSHAVVMDVHPPDRFLPEFLVDVLQSAVETTSEEMPDFGTPHIMGIVLEEFPEQVVSADVSEDSDVGFALVWVTDFDARRLHEVIVELVVELMEHAVSHAEDESAMTDFEQQMMEFDVSEFVDQYRAERDLDADDYPGY